MTTAVCIGELLIDFVSAAPDVSLADAPAFVKAPGGAPANVAVGLVRHGVQAAFAGKVGQDPFGEFLQSILLNAGVDVRALRFDPDARTTLAFVATRSDGRKDLTFYRNPGADQRLRPDELDRNLLAQASLIHFGSVSLSHEPSRSATLEAVKQARAAGALVSFDPNVRPALWDDTEMARRCIWEAMPMADVVKLADEEFEFVTGTTDVGAGARRVLDAGPRLVVTTLGPAGCAFDDGVRRGEVPGFPARVVDTLGAGDAFMAAFLSRLLANLPRIKDENWLRQALRFANAAGALATQTVGVIPALPTTTEVEQFLAGIGG